MLFSQSIKALFGHSLILYLFGLGVYIGRNLLISSNYLTLAIKVFPLAEKLFQSYLVALTEILAF